MENSVPRIDTAAENQSGRFKTLAMVYPVPQQWRELYDADVGLERGTIFRELDMPLESVKSNRQANGNGGRR